MTDEPCQITEIKRAKSFLNNGVTDPSSSDDELDYYNNPMEWLYLVTNLLSSEGPIIIDVNIYKHALGCYDEEQLTKMGLKEDDDLIVIGTDEKMITLSDLNKFFDAIINKPWPEGRSYALNGIFNKYQHTWVQREHHNCDYFVNWDS